MAPLSKARFLSAYAVTFRVLVSYFAAGLQQWILRVPLSDEGWIALHQKNAGRIASTFSRLRGIYIKIGQSLSVMGQFLPEPFTKGFESLQDSALPTPIAEVEAVIASSLGKHPRELFASFDSKPIATASLGQVHAATLLSGDKVAVKVQHPYIERLVRKDLRTLKRIFGLFHSAFPRYGIKGIYRECAEMIRQELDFLQEGQNCETLAANLKDMPQCRFPKIYWEYSAQKVLTLEFISGIKISHTGELDRAGLDRRTIATYVLKTYCRQIFEDGFYHADPHPGNILIEEMSTPEKVGPRVIYLDFGATARISERMRAGMTRFVEGLIEKDTQVLSQALKQMGFVAKGADKDELCERIVEYFYGKLSTLNVESIKDLHQAQTLAALFEPSQLDFSFRELATTFHIPREWVLLERTLLILLGLCAKLDPALNPVHIVFPYVEAFVLGKGRHLSDLVLQMLKEAGSSYLTLGLKLEEVLKKLERGDIAVRVDLVGSIGQELRTGMRLVASVGILALNAFLLYKSNAAPLYGWRTPLAWGMLVWGLVVLRLFFKRG